MRSIIVALAGYMGALTGLLIESTFFFWIFCWAFRIPFTWKLDVGIWAAILLIRTAFQNPAVPYYDHPKHVE